MENMPVVPTSATATTAAVNPSPDTTAPVAAKAPEAVAPVAVATPVVTTPKQPQLAPEPNCTLVGTKLTIHPQPNEVGYDVIVIKDGDNEEMIGKRKLDLIMPSSALVIENLFDDKEMYWLRSPENGGTVYVIRVFAVNTTGVQSAPKSFPPATFEFQDEPETGSGTTTGERPPPPVEPKIEKAVSASVVVLSPEDKTALNTVPARLSKIDRDLGALPKGRSSAWSALRRMTLGLEQIEELLTRLQSLFGDKPDVNIANLLAQVKKLNDRVENTRALRSDKYGYQLRPTLLKIRGLLEKLGYGPGQPGEKIAGELTTILAITNSKDPGMTMTDIHALIPRSEDMLAEVEALLATKQEKEVSDKTKAEADTAKKAEAAAKAKTDANAAKAKAEAQTKADAEAKAKAEAAAQAESEKALLLAKVQALIAEKLEAQEKAEAAAKAKAEADAAAATAQAAATAATPQASWWARNKKWAIIGTVVGLVLGTLAAFWFFNRPSNSGSASKPTASAPAIDQASPGTTPATFPVTTPGTNDVTEQILAELATLRKEIANTAQSTNPAVKLPERFTAKAQGNNNRNVGIGYNTGTIVGGDLIQNYYGSATPTPGMTSIPSGLSCQPKADGSYYWEKVLHAGESIGYKVSKGFVLCPRYSARKSELVIEVKGQDGQWKVVPTGEMLGNLQGSECRFTMKTTATETAELSFKLVPVANPKP